MNLYSTSTAAAILAIAWCGTPAATRSAEADSPQIKLLRRAAKMKPEERAKVCEKPTDAVKRDDLVTVHQMCRSLSRRFPAEGAMTRWVMGEMIELVVAPEGGGILATVGGYPWTILCAGDGRDAVTPVEAGGGGIGGANSATVMRQEIDSGREVSKNHFQFDDQRNVQHPTARPVVRKMASAHSDAPTPSAIIREKLATLKKEWAAATGNRPEGESLEEYSARVQRGQAIKDRIAAELYQAAEAHPDDEAAAEALASCVMHSMTADTTTKAIKLMAQRYAWHPQVIPCLMRAKLSPAPAVAELMEAVTAQNQDRKARGLAQFGLGWWHAYHSKDLAQAKRILEGALKNYGDVEIDPFDHRSVGAECRLLLQGRLALRPGTRVPDIAMADADGKAVKMSALKGKVVLVEFTASWCGACKALLEPLKSMHQELKEQPFEIVAVHVDPVERVRESMAKGSLPWRCVVGEGGMAGQWGVSSFPAVCVVDQEGVIRSFYRDGEAAGLAVKGGLRREVMDLLEKPQRAKTHK